MLGWEYVGAVASVRRTSLLASILACLAILAGCSALATHPTPTYSVPIATVDPNPTNPPWFAVALTDVNTGKSFKIADFVGKVVLIDTMATWCPTCQGEMSQVQDLIDTVGPDRGLVAVSLDVDPNEDATILQKFAATNNFGWRIAIAPTEVGQFLATHYDVEYLNPPLQPMLIIDRQGGVWGLPFGIKSSISLRKTLESYLAAP